MAINFCCQDIRADERSGLIIRMNLAASRTTLEAALDSMAGALKKISA
jgi:bifunctional pyridoxal-dependent enzyme with beta-cystathionase and maltose regulon repressor activities